MNAIPELQRIFNEIKSKTFENKEKAAEELQKNFKNYLESSEEVSIFY